LSYRDFDSGEFKARALFRRLVTNRRFNIGSQYMAACDAGSQRLESMVDDHGGSDRRTDDESSHPLTASLETAALREQATGVLAWYHQIEPSEASSLLCVLAEYLDCSIDVLAAEVLRKAAARHALMNGSRSSGNISPDEDGTPQEARPRATSSHLRLGTDGPGGDFGGPAGG
jgi:hypothetical protein